MTKLNVHQMITEVTKQIASVGISKNKKNQHQGYQFRGIDDVYNTLAPIISDVGLNVLPKVTGRTVTERPNRNGGLLFYVVLDVEYHFISSHDGSVFVVHSIGEGMDSGDKATNKAMSAAYKYACFQAFCIPIEGENDAEPQTHEVVKGKKGNMTAGKFKDMCSDFAAQIRDAGHIDDLKVMIGSPEWVEFKDEAMLRGEMNVIDQEGGLKDQHTRKWNQLKEQAEFEGQ